MIERVDFDTTSPVVEILLQQRKVRKIERNASPSMTMVVQVTPVIASTSYQPMAMIFDLFWIIGTVLLGITFGEYENENVEFGNLNNKFENVDFVNVDNDCDYGAPAFPTTPRTDATPSPTPAPHLTAIEFDNNGVEIAVNSILAYIFGLNGMYIFGKK